MKKAQLSTYFIHNTKVFAQLAKEVHERPTEENVHKMRTTIRRLRSVLALMKVTSKHKQLKKLARRLGEQRDLDVALINANKFKLSCGKLKKRQKKQRKLTQEILRPKKIIPLKESLSKVAQKISEHPPLKLETSFAAKKKELQKLKHKNMSVEELHRARILVKEVRYLMEAMGKPTTKLKKLQNLLGEIHDLEILQEKLGKDAAVAKVMAAKIKRFELLT